jgi:hypothetical protein
MASLDVLRDYLMAACEMHGKAYTEALLTGWNGCTKSVSDKQLTDCWWNVCIHKFPTPSELLQAVAGINPTDDWDKIMAVATGRAATITISGFAAAALRSVGGIRAIANANDYDTRQLHQDWLAALQTAGSGLPAAEEEISLLPIAAKPKLDDHFYPFDITGEIRANALIKCLGDGRVTTKIAKAIVSGGGKSLGVPHPWPAAQRDRVLAHIEDSYSD